MRTPTTLATYFIWCQKRSLAMTASLTALTDRLRSVGADTPAYPSCLRPRRKSHEKDARGRGLALTRRARHGVCRDRDPDLDLAGREPGRGPGRARAHGRSRRAERARNHRGSPPRRGADSHGRRPLCPGRYRVPGGPRAAAPLPAARGGGAGPAPGPAEGAGVAARRHPDRVPRLLRPPRLCAVEPRAAPRGDDLEPGRLVWARHLDPRGGTGRSAARHLDVRRARPPCWR